MSLIRKEKDSMVLLLKILLVSVELILVGHALDETIDFLYTLSSYILRRPQNFAKSPLWLALRRKKVRFRFRKILWPSQNL